MAHKVTDEGYGDVMTMPARDTDPVRSARRVLLRHQAAECMEGGRTPTHDLMVEMHRAGMTLPEIDGACGVKQGTAHDSVVFEFKYGALGGGPKKGALGREAPHGA